jgi:hypothetical protein
MRGYLLKTIAITSIVLGIVAIAVVALAHGGRWTAWNTSPVANYNYTRQTPWSTPYAPMGHMGGPWYMDADHDDVPVAMPPRPWGWGHCIMYDGTPVMRALANIEPTTITGKIVDVEFNIAIINDGVNNITVRIPRMYVDTSSGSIFYAPLVMEKLEGRDVVVTVVGPVAVAVSVDGTEYMLPWYYWYTTTAQQ